MAALASQTLLSRMGSAFWDAFAGAATPAQAGGAKGMRAWDADKVRRVLEGKAVVRVVDIDQPTTSSSSPSPPEDSSLGLEDRMRSMSIGSSAESKSACSSSHGIFHSIRK